MKKDSLHLEANYKEVFEYYKKMTVPECEEKTFIGTYESTSSLFLERKDNCVALSIYDEKDDPVLREEVRGSVCTFILCPEEIEDSILFLHMRYAVTYFEAASKKQGEEEYKAARKEAFKNASTRDKLIALYKLNFAVLSEAPAYDDCTDEEEELYAELANLKQAIEDFIQDDDVLDAAIREDD